MGGPAFRAGVVAVITRDDGFVLAFERADTAGAWQLPQGSIASGETPVTAVWRELGEETGLGPEDVMLVGEHPSWTCYELPEELRSAQRDPSRLGKALRWFFFRPTSDILEPVPDGRELVAWQWMRPDDLVSSVAAFRRDAYRAVLGRRR